jgi:lysine-ketoglutarate reductase/saccharopine dehydrogenase-like protein (TIGR00300 family)
VIFKTERNVAQEIVELRGHLIDSLILPRVLDVIMSRKACFEIQRIKVGARAQDPSFARILIGHRDPQTLETILHAVGRYGAEPVERREARVERATQKGVFPATFYATTNLDTEVRLRGRWVRVRNPEMDCGIRVGASGRTAETVKMADARRGDRIVIGEQGVRVFPIETRRRPKEFEFMSSEISTEKPKSALIRTVARLMKQERASGRPILWVCGPAIVHSGAGPLLERLIAAGYMQRLFAGNALAAHDVESTLMGTSLGVELRAGARARSGHENHLRAINTIRAAGGIRRAVQKRILRSGIMHACVRHRVDFVLAGSIRDDGPLPEVISEATRAQQEMRRRTPDVRLAILVATLLHAVAAGNMLPAHARVVCVDIQPSAVTKLMDRGTFQTIGIVTDVQPFLRELLLELKVKL